jgi:uncharacterized membrane protein
MAVSGRGPILAAGLLLGAGLGGFVDGIALHQLLQWHHMLSSEVPPVDVFALKLNMFWDGLFHALVWLMTAGGLALVWRARAGGPRPTAALVGSLLGGWGLFNLVEGLVDHELLRIHHVHPGAGELSWDLAFIAAGLLLLGAGYLIARTPRPTPAPAAARAIPFHRGPAPPTDGTQSSP